MTLTPKKDYTAWPQPKITAEEQKAEAVWSRQRSIGKVLAGRARYHFDEIYGNAWGQHLSLTINTKWSAYQVSGSPSALHQEAA